MFGFEMSWIIDFGVMIVSSMSKELLILPVADLGRIFVAFRFIAFVFDGFFSLVFMSSDSRIVVPGILLFEVIGSVLMKVWVLVVGISNSRIVDFAVKMSSEVKFEGSIEFENDSMLLFLMFRGTWNFDWIIFGPLILVARISVSWVVDSVVVKLSMEESKIILSEVTEIGFVYSCMLDVSIFEKFDIVVSSNSESWVLIVDIVGPLT